MNITIRKIERADIVPTHFKPLDKQVFVGVVQESAGYWFVYHNRFSWLGSLIGPWNSYDEAIQAQDRFYAIKLEQSFIQAAKYKLLLKLSRSGETA